MTDFEESSDRSMQAAQPGVNEPLLGQSLKRAGDLIASHRLEEAEEELRATRETAPPDSRVLALLALVYFKRGNLPHARLAYREATTLAPTDSSLWLNLGLVAIKLGTYEEAISALETAVKLRPEDRRAYGYLGYAYAKQEKHGQAATAFRRAGQHELAAEMERNAPFSATEPPVVDATPPPVSAPAPKTPGPELNSPIAMGGRDPSAGALGESRSGGDALLSLGEFVARSVLDLSASPPLVSRLGERGVRYHFDGGAFVRESALLVALAGQSMRLARKRIRGSLADQYVTASGDRFLQFSGQGDVLMTPPGPTSRLVCLSLDKDVLYLDESRVVAFSESLVFEVGRIPGRGLPLLQLRGTGHVVVGVGESEIVSMRVREGDSFVIPLPRIVGWLGRVVVQGEIGGEMQNTTLRYVTCEGEGVLLLSRHAESR